MSKRISITDKLNDEKPTIEIGEKVYEINDSMETVLKFEELSNTGNRGVMSAMKMALGEEAFNEIGVEKLSINNFKVLTTAIMASMQGLTYEDAAARFQSQGV